MKNERNMKKTQTILDDLTEEAKASPRLRKNMDLAIVLRTNLREC